MAVRLAVFDLDGTLLSGSKTVMPTLAGALWDSGLERGLGFRLFALAGLIGLVRKLRLINRERYTAHGSKLIARWMAALEPDSLDRILDATARKLLVEARPDVVAEVQLRRAEGCRTVIVSAVVQPLLARMARHLNCDAVGTRLELTPEGRYTGRLDGAYCSGPGKALALKKWAESLGEPIDWAGSYAYADTLPDLPVLETVGHAVAVAPEPTLRREAEHRGWRVIEG